MSVLLAEADLCKACKRSPDGVCSTYYQVGTINNNRRGYCPATGKYASWRTDKPKKVKSWKRIGQQKQKKEK